MARAGGTPENLRPWKAGETGNPRGRPKSFETFAAIMARVMDEPTGAPVPETETKKERICRVHVEKAMRGDPASTALVVERTEGKVADKLVSEQSIRLTPWDEADAGDFAEARAASDADDEA